MLLSNRGFLSIFYALFLLIFIIEGIYILLYNTLGNNFTIILIWELFLLYIVSIIYSIRTYGISNIFSLFLLCLGLFNFQKFFWDGILHLNFRYADSLIRINLPESVVQKTILIYCIFTLFVSWTYVSIRSRSELNFFGFHNSTDIKLLNAGTTLFYITIPFVLYKSYLEVSGLIGKSYTEFYVGENSESIPFYLRLALLIFQVAYMIFLGSRPPVKKFYWFSILYLITIIPYLFIGLRANFAVAIIFLFWYYNEVYKIKIPYKKIIPILFGLLIIFQYISISRTNSNRSGNVIEMVPQFLYEQSQSMYVLALYVQYKENIIPNSRPFLLDPFFSGFYPSGQSVEVAKERSSLGHSLTFSLSQDYYLSGASLGTNFIAELYEFNIWGIVFGAIFFGYIIFFFEKKMKKSNLYFMFSFAILQYILLAPRSSYFINVYFILKILLVYIFVLFLFRIYKLKYLK